jgi:hypothetical protein
MNRSKQYSEMATGNRQPATGNRQDFSHFHI